MALYKSKTNAAHKQSAYVIYMIMGSYFKRCTCKSKMLEKQLYLHYKDLPYGKQEKLEERIISYVEDRYADYLDHLALMDAEAYIIPQREGYEVVFEFAKRTITFLVDKNGKFRGI